MNNEELVQEITKDFSIILPKTISFERLRAELAVYLNQLIQTDFQRLITLLYRIDVSEVKLKKLLQQQASEEAGKIIADLIIERQLQKIASRQQYRRREDSGSDEEKW